jgi:wyosine [tRNA(Phe)-imidazoG37] synthetase (radical SAM superfamily)
MDIQNDPGNTYLPAPITVSIDPANVCNAKCLYCNADFILNKNRGEMLSPKYLIQLAEFLHIWGVKGACLGGGGEALCNPYTGAFIKDLKEIYNIGVGIVSNGILIDKHPELEYLDWIGVSVDAATPETWGLVHGTKPDIFLKVMYNMKQLVKKGVHVTYKYLVRPEAVYEVYDAVIKAREIGVMNFHIRPGANPWFKDTKKEFFTDDDVKSVKEQLTAAKADLPEMNIIGVFNKVGSHWQVEHPFKTCHAVLATCVFQANKKVGFCCDNRGNPTFEIGPYDNPTELLNFWGSKEHYKLINDICVNSCTRCTFSIFNQYFEQAILKDGFMLNFI